MRITLPPHYLLLALLLYFPAVGLAQLSISCPADIFTGTDPGQCEATVFYEVPQGSGSGTNIVTQMSEGLPSGASFPQGTTQITYTVSNAEGASSECTFFITVSDQEPPQFACSEPLIVPVSPGNCTAVITYDMPELIENCNLLYAQQTDGPASGSMQPIGTYEVYFEAMDFDGNMGLCTLLVQVSDMQAPELSCPSDSSIVLDAPACGAAVVYNTPTATDCGEVSITQNAGLGSGAYFGAGSWLESYTAIDAAGNSSSCSFTIEVVELTPPTLSCPSASSVAATGGQCGSEVNFATPTAGDDCGAVEMQQTAGAASGSFFPVGATSITYEASDVSGNISSCQFTISVVDEEPPQLTCGAPVLLYTGPDECVVEVAYAPPTASDNCAVAALVLLSGPAPGAELAPGTYSALYQAEDASGNTAQCSIPITVLDTVAPALNCSDSLWLETTPGTCTVLLPTTPPTATDGCSTVTVQQLGGPSPGSSLSPGEYLLLWQATDASGNTSHCDQLLTISDNNPPLLSCISDTVLYLESTCSLVLPDFAPQVADNCPQTNIEQLSGPSAGQALGAGNYTMVFRAEDAHGNADSCTVQLSILDSEAPQFTSCEAQQLRYLTESCALDSAIAVPVATDNCASTLSQVEGPVPSFISLPGLYELVFEAEDSFGNSAQCTLSLEVLDTLAPQLLDCPQPFTSCSTTPDFAAPAAVDLCGNALVAVLMEGLPPGATYPLGSTQVLYVATDSSGNTASCSFEVEVLAAAQAAAGTDTVLCATAQYELQANEPEQGSGQWALLSGAGLIAAPDSAATTVSGLAPGVNSLLWSVDPGNGCPSVSDSLEIVVVEELAVDLGEDLRLSPGETVALSAAVVPAGGSYTWAPAGDLSCSNCAEPLWSGDSGTTILLHYLSPEGCKTSDTLTIIVTSVIPNTFTPNGDGVNDTWIIPGAQRYPSMEVHIFNRAGIEVYGSVGYRQAWDGNWRGSPQPTGAYLYLIDFKDERAAQQGTLNLLR